MSVWTTYGVGTITAGESVTVMQGKLARLNSTKPVVLYAPGYGMLADAMLGGYLRQIITALVEAGYPVVSTDLGGTATWGSDVALARVTAARTWAQANYAVKAGKIICLGLSMGATTMLNWAAANPTLTAGVIGVSPVCDLNDMTVNNRGGYKASIDTAYGTYLQTRDGAAHNPVTMAAASKYAAVPLRMFTGDVDPIVVPATVTALVAAATTAGGVASQTVLPGAHSTAVWDAVDPAAVLTFVKAVS